MRYAKEAVGRHPPVRPLAGLRGAILAGAASSAVNTLIAGTSPLIPAVLFLLAALLGAQGR